MSVETTYDCGCVKRPGTAKLYTCPECGPGHGYSTEPFTCDGDYHAPVEAIEVEVIEIDTLKEMVRQELRPDPDEPGRGWKVGALADAIGEESGSASMEFTSPEHVRDGICNWLDSLKVATDAS